mmetsp:Transcript_22793/g.64054  ORF Transcript_22793/g.64054 Transcript_22793/m.64054 type:complete len:211 (+) Transcript_22793:364-996(+)
MEVDAMAMLLTLLPSAVESAAVCLREHASAMRHVVPELAFVLLAVAPRCHTPALPRVAKPLARVGATIFPDEGSRTILKTVPVTAAAGKGAGAQGRAPVAQHAAGWCRNHRLPLTQRLRITSGHSRLRQGSVGAPPAEDFRQREVAKEDVLLIVESMSEVVLAIPHLLSGPSCVRAAACELALEEHDETRGRRGFEQVADETRQSAVGSD